MAIQSVKHGLPFPAWPTGVSSLPSFSSYLIDASGEKAALVFQATAAKAIHKIHFRTGTVLTGDTVDCRVETLDASGDPSGTLATASANGSAVVASDDDNAWKSATLTADHTPAIGDYVALVIVNGGAGGNMSIVSFQDASASSRFPYGEVYTTAWAKGATPALIVPEYSDGSFEPIFGYIDAGGPINSNAINSGTATTRHGNIFQLAFPCRAKGCWVWIDADGDFTVKLYDSDGSTVLATTATVTSAYRESAGSGIQFYPFTTTASLSRDTNYRLAVVPSSVTSLTVYDFDVPAAGMLDMFPGGQSCRHSVYTSGAWAETTTRRSYLGVLLDGFDDGVSAGGIGGRVIGGGF